MKKTYLLIADAHRARCFERQDADHALVELADFVSARMRLANAPPTSDVSGDAGKGHGRTGHAGTQFEPHTEAPDKERTQFAQQLASYLNTAVAEQRCNALALIATSPLLGELKPLLSKAAAQSLQRTVVKDLTHYMGPELLERVNHALAAHD